MGDWLGTGRLATHLRQYRPFEEARVFARSLGLKSSSAWQDFIKSGNLPPDIPRKPSKSYVQDGWRGYGDWLGTGQIAPSLKQYRSFEDARNFVRTLGLRSERGWRDYVKSGALPLDIPRTPNEVYADEGWLGMGDWLRTGFIATFQRQFRQFDLAQTWARELGLKSVAEWRVYTCSDEFPHDIPVAPNQTYKDGGWTGYGDWLGTGRKPRRTRKSADHTSEALIRSMQLSQPPEGEQPQ